MAVSAKAYALRNLSHYQSPSFVDQKPSDIHVFLLRVNVVPVETSLFRLAALDAVLIRHERCVPIFPGLTRAPCVLKVSGLVVHIVLSGILFWVLCRHVFHVSNVSAGGFEPPTLRFQAGCSTKLSYARLLCVLVRHRSEGHSDVDFRLTDLSEDAECLPLLV